MCETERKKNNNNDNDNYYLDFLGECSWYVKHGYTSTLYQNHA